MYIVIYIRNLIENSRIKIINLNIFDKLSSIRIIPVFFTKTGFIIKYIYLIFYYKLSNKSKQF